MVRLRRHRSTSGRYRDCRLAFRCSNWEIWSIASRRSMLFCGRSQSTISSDTIRCREELLLHEAEATDRHREGHDSRKDRHPAPAHGKREKPRRTCSAKRPFVVIVLDFMVFGRIVTPRRGVKRTATTQDTISDTAMTTNSVKVNSPAALVVEADRDEASDRHQRAGQHWKGGGGIDMRRRTREAYRRPPGERPSSRRQSWRRRPAGRAR